MSVVDVGDFGELDSILKSNSLVVVEFGASWCGPCRQFRPHFDAYSDIPDAPVCAYVDVDLDPAFITEFRIQSVPQVMLFRDSVYLTHLEARNVVKLVQEYASVIDL